MLFKVRIFATFLTGSDDLLNNEDKFLYIPDDPNNISIKLRVKKTKKNGK